MTARRADIAAWALLLASSAASAAPVRLVWEGVAGAVSYELEVPGAPKLAISSPSKVLELARPASGRIRPVFPGGVAGPWYPIPLRKWEKPVLPELVQVDAGEAKQVSWDPPPSAAGRSELTYRVRLLTAQGSPVYDALIEGTRVTLPKLPGADFKLVVEPVGDARHGSLHLEGEGAATTQVETEPIPYDPAAEAAAARARNQPRDLVALSDPFVEGLALDSYFARYVKVDSSSIDFFQKIRLTGSGGFQFSLSVPFVLAESGDSPSFQSQAPRIGGNPYPWLGIAQRLAGDSRRNLGIGAHVSTTTDTSGQKSDVPNYAEAFVQSQALFGSVLFQAAFGIGLGIPKSMDTAPGAPSVRILAHKVESAGLSAYYLPRPEWMIGPEITWFYSGRIRADVSSFGSIPVQEPVHSGSIGLGAKYRVNADLLAYGGLAGYVGQAGLRGTSSSTYLGITWVY